ncbi:hypothetical protein TESG_00818 [Trichophyton tonsurans CBS 112818]|uniref:Uncharacterized protein n=1 Tax=Trichophyton tonsurans (strain CBS 112818) TaxID=647933 RepID=F2RPN6_TRIT1|nr:hypothetical protein TESG_00818 [Trichophyton tonsurans CBS 112818]
MEHLGDVDGISFFGLQFFACQGRSSVSIVERRFRRQNEDEITYSVYPSGLVSVGLPQFYHVWFGAQIHTRDSVSARFVREDFSEKIVANPGEIIVTLCCVCTE